MAKKKVSFSSYATEQAVLQKNGKNFDAISGERKGIKKVQNRKNEAGKRAESGKWRKKQYRYK